METPVRHTHPALPEAFPQHDTWAALLWPWLDRIDIELPRCAVVARSLAYALDDRDGTVDTERVRTGTPERHRQVVDELSAVGLLEPANPGRHRVVLPERVPPPRTRRRR
jgi:hypothetical protein